MRADLDLKLSHDGKRWVACNAMLEAQGEDFLQLDAALTEQLRARAEFPAGSRVRVFMGFDFDTLPRWMRQYQSHYFNRYVTIEL